MAKTFNVGDKVRAIDNHYGNTTLDYGFEGVVVSTSWSGACKIKQTKPLDRNAGFEWAGLSAEHFELVDGVPKKKQRIKALEIEVEALKSEVAELKKAQKPYVIGVDLAITPNQRRKAVIERAKAFVADVEYLALDSGGNTERWSRKRAELKQFSNCVTKPEYHVNKEKRVVTVLVKGAITTVLFEKAIAKCAPGDVFNVHIGKAIALAKAYGLEIPQEFTNAPQPEIAVGQVVYETDTKDTHTVSKVLPEIPFKKSPKTGIVYEGTAYEVGFGWRTGWSATNLTQILDDSEAVYE